MADTPEKALQRLARFFDQGAERLGIVGGSPRVVFAWENAKQWAEAQAKRADGQRRNWATKRGMTDDELRALYLAASGSHSERFKVILDEYSDRPGFSPPNLTKRLNALGFYGDGQRAKPPRRKCMDCGKDFQPRINKDDRLCRVHRARAERDGISSHN